MVAFGARNWCTGIASKISDIGVAAGLAVILMLMVVPIPEELLDALLAVNICVGMTLLLMAAYVSAPTDIPVFPSVLLIGTVFRLAISIAATRMILTRGEAGQIIDTFGRLGAGGNIVIGLVVFAVITLVQFIVIAKGAERVGEVSARFTLDAMPGKQMSIDSDLRSGLIDKDDARRRRRLLELESRLYGNLDGAMKFIKGDAIAGICILLVNLVAGLTIGILQRHLTLSDAVHTYSILTIGDGMVAQIPALLFALSAGLLVTRTAAEGAEGHLGEAIRRQFLQQPRVPLVGGILCIGLALVPGFPLACFLTLGATGIVAGVALDPVLQPQLANWLVRRGLIVRGAPSREGSIEPAALSETPALELLVSDDDAGCTNSELESLLRELLRDFEHRLGFSLPPVRYRRDESAGSSKWRLLAFGVPIGRGDLSQTDPDFALREELFQVLRRRLGLFIGMQEAATLVQRVSQTHPDITKELLRTLSPMRVGEVLRLLVEEEVALRPLPLILETLADAGQREKDGPALAAVVRAALHRQIVERYAPEGELRAVALAPALERQLREALNSPSGAAHFALTPAATRGLIAEIGRAVTVADAMAVVVPVELRRQLRKLIEADLFEIPVLAYSELKSPLAVRIIERIAPLAAEAEAA